MGDIGQPQKETEFEPFPASVPVPEPATTPAPVREPEPVGT